MRLVITCSMTVSICLLNERQLTGLQGSISDPADFFRGVGDQLAASRFA